MIDGWRDLLEAWVTDPRSRSAAMSPTRSWSRWGDAGTDRTTRRAIAEIKTQWRLGNTRVHRA